MAHEEILSVGEVVAAAHLRTAVAMRQAQYVLGTARCHCRRTTPYADREILTVTPIGTRQPAHGGETAIGL